MPSFDFKDLASRFWTQGITKLTQPAVTVGEFGINFNGLKGLNQSDFSGPTLTRSVPANVGDAWSGVFQFYAYDSPAGLAEVLVWLDMNGGAVLAYDGTAQAGFSVSAVPQGNGSVQYTISGTGVETVYNSAVWHVRATDKAGNVSEVSWAFTTSAPPTPDTTPPAIVIGSYDLSFTVIPYAGGESIPANQLVVVTVQDDNIQKWQVWVYINGDTAPELVFDGSSFTTKYSTSANYQDSGIRYLELQRAGGWVGECIFVVYAFDAFLNEASDTVTVEAPPATPADSTPPSISNFVPSPGTGLERFDPVQFDITDLGAGLALCLLAVSFPGLAAPEVAYDGQAFTTPYLAASSVSTISGGFRFILKRAGGWPANSLSVTPYAMDSAGNENT